MADTEGAADVDLDDVVARAGQAALRGCSPCGWRHAAGSTSTVGVWRRSAVVACSLTVCPHRPTRRNGRDVSSVRSWMEFGPDAWTTTFIEVWPARWREEREQTSFEPSRFVYGGATVTPTGLITAKGVKVTDGSKINHEPEQLLGREQAVGE